jgi:hypothetical protein
VTWPCPLVAGRERRYGDTRILEAAVRDDPEGDVT